MFISNIDNNPIFSWKIKSNTPDFYQSACQLLIADNQADLEFDRGNIWDSGKIEKMNDFQIKYPGDNLANGHKYYVRLKVWNDKNVAGNWSEVKEFYTPLEYPKNWEANWITNNYQPDSALSVFRKKIELNKDEEIEYARLYISAPGFYEAFLNGEKIGKNVLDPGQTNYEDYTFYSAYNLDLNTIGNSFVLGVMLGNGWYNQNVVWGKDMIYGQPVFIAQLVIQYKNGTRKIIGTDESWLWKPGPITFTNVYAGETYDANKEVKDWFESTTDSSWNSALLSDNHPNNLLEQYAQPIQEMDTLSAKKIITKGDGRYIFDFGQNFAGWVKIEVEGEKGQEITLRCVEVLDENGEIDPRTTGVRATKVIQTQKYICKGEGNETWKPKFTYFGFRYVEVEGLTERPSNDFLTGIVVYSSLPKTGNFSCSEENINKLHQLADWTIKSNIHSIPTDCPHREKCGWTGDAHAVAQTLIYNYNAQQFLRKYIFDMRSSARNTNKELYFGINFSDRSIIDKPFGIPTMIVPGKRTSGTASPDWGTAMTQLPWYLYLYYGDEILLQNFYPDMKVWTDYIQAKSEDGLIQHGLGDWCPPGGNKNIDCPVSVSSTAFHILDLKIMAKSAKVLGIEADYEYYANLHKKAVADFNRHFFDTVNYTYGSQTADAMALEIGIVPENQKHKVAESIVKNIHEKYEGFINTGIFGIARLFGVLAENGFEDEVYRLLSKKGDNSFAFMWENYNATTLWEVLPVRSKEFDDIKYRSHSHPMQAGFDKWFYSGIAGINPFQDGPGFNKISFKPYLTRYMENADASYETVYGTVKSAWKNEGGKFVWHIQIPENTKGEINVPNYGNAVSVLVNGKESAPENTNSDFTFIGEFGSGEYFIEMQNL